MTFPNKEVALVAIKQYHIAEGFKFVFMESKTDRFIARFPGTIVEYVTQPFVIYGVQDNSCNIFERAFRAFKPCINGFNYCKPIVQVDGTFLTGKYHENFLTAIGQDGNQNIFPLTFAIVEGETKEALIWFFCLWQSHVIPQQNICMITDRGKAILLTLKFPEVAWKDMKFKNVEAKRQLINMGYEMKQPIVQAKLLALRSQFQQAFAWIDQIPLKKWTQAYDRGRRYGHMTTNLAKCMNSILKGARLLPILLFYNRQNSRLDLQELSIVQLRRLPMSYTIRLNDWWCDCWDFQALQLPCAHVIAVCSACHLQLKTFVDPIYNYWSTYMGPNFIPNPHMHRKETGRPTTDHIHNEMDEPLPNKQKKNALI
uniref:SWIM-type domain-containing protein n=1 Tax=Phaseolus vulgaris TaxID=3885 RepID=V7C265_PHAVU|nr:hypothetical protein PHAVU_004G111700g [Phaseolus vulgaris]ESW24214.1 hypothetical protein PHAVU_004G111700g [Phaseolus vulgaris]